LYCCVVVILQSIIIMSVGSMLSFNIADGYVEGLVRGYRSGILTTADYANLVQCDTLEDLKLHLASTDYGDFLANESEDCNAADSKATQDFIMQSQL